LSGYNSLNQIMIVITFSEPVKNENSDLPTSYREFVGKYGYGTYCGIINITEPDDQVIYSTFSDDEYWEFTQVFSEDDFKKAIQLASTIEGDIICYVKGKPNQLFILPRNSETILSFDNLNNAFAFYHENYRLSDVYFEPLLERNIENFSLINGEKLIDITLIHNQFLKDFEYDFIIGKEQPKYVIKKIGGWIKFDLVYKNSISISYQVTESPDNAYAKYVAYIKSAIALHQ